jgi:hypothetical protein
LAGNVSVTLGHGRVATASEADVEIRREQRHVILPRVEQHVCQDRNGVLALHDALQERQFLE